MIGEPLGRRHWAIAEGYLPRESVSQEHALASHEAACILNAFDEDADIFITLFFTGREPCRSYQLIVAARRTLYLRFNDLTDPEPVPRDISYASVVESSVPIVVQHTRSDSGNLSITLLSTVAFAA